MPVTWPEYEAARRKSRRRFIVGLALAGVGTLAGVSLLATPFLRQGPYPSRPKGLKTLDDLRYHVLRAVALVILPAGADPAPALLRLDETLAGVDLHLRRALLATPTLLEGSGFLLAGRLSPFSELPADEQARVLDRWAASHLLVCREAVATMRQLVVVHHYGGQNP